VITGDASDPNGPFFPYVNHTDYTVEPSGQLTLIRAVSARIKGHNLLVSYTYTPSPSGSYDTFTEAFNIRLSLWNELWAIYARYNADISQGNSLAVVPDGVAYTFGTDVSWRFLRAGAEYEVYDYNLTSYRSTHLYETMSFTLPDGDGLALDFNQSFIDYMDSGQKEQDYRFIARYHRALGYNLYLTADGGYDYHTGQGVDETLGVFRATLDYSIGRTTISAGYDYEYDLYLNSQERNKNMFNIRIKRLL
jgi:hypothetical protein